jgi:hypothetical protein
MDIAMRMVVRILFATEVITRAIVKCQLYAYKTHTKLELPFCVFSSRFEDTNKM